MRNQPSLQRLIPVTALRHLYELLRDLPREEFQLAVAREFDRRPEQLAKLVDESRTHFSLYDNRGERFHERDASGLLTEARSSSEQLANILVQDLVQCEAKIESAPQYEFRVVDYDISPFRTTGAMFENGKSGRSSGAGGIDLLLSNRFDKTPIVAEIKADTDVNPFFGLIQGLMYAVELSTPSQRARLVSVYPEHFGTLSAQTGIDIYLFLLRYSQDEVSQEFLKLTNRVAASLLAECSPVSRIVRRIVALTNQMLPGDVGHFEIAFAHDCSTVV